VRIASWWELSVIGVTGLSSLFGLDCTVRADTIAYYRFETGPAGAAASSILDSSPNNLNGTIFGTAPTYNSGVDVTHVPQTGRVNNFSMTFNPAQAARFAYPFPFHTFSSATLEFWINATDATGWDVIWTTEASGDQNRFNVYVAGSGGPSSSEACIDYREPNGTIHVLGCSGPGTVPANEWSYVAYIKNGNDYSIYVNSSATGHVTTLASDITDASPNLPTSTVWTINGRTVINGCCGGVGGVADELRLSNQALSPSQFLITAPVFPVTISIKPPAKAPVLINLGSGGVTPVAILSSAVFDHAGNGSTPS
jgi:hypothetical protein